MTAETTDDAAAGYVHARDSGDVTVDLLLPGGGIKFVGVVTGGDARGNFAADAGRF